MKQFFFAYIVAVNLLACLCTIIDKHNAKHSRRRISENSLFVVSIAGGSVGMFITMLLVRHKTRKIKFMAGIPIIIFLQAIGICVYWWFFCADRANFMQLLAISHLLC